nr:immunoglobulin light chain junction region [Macaca mulatta]MOX89865.1 immunoglobulin light chain junction region [Macaca mulatta]
CLQYDSVPRTF